MQPSNDARKGPAQEPITITDQNVSDWICARAHPIGNPTWIFRDSEK